MKKLLVLCMVLAILLVPAECFSENAPVAAVDIASVQGPPGEIVYVPVSISSNPELIGMKLTITYDDALTLVDAKKGDAFSYLNMTASKELTSPCNFIWDGVSFDEAAGNDGGVILTLQFQLSSDAELGKTYSIEGCLDDVVNNDLMPVNLDCHGGKVTAFDPDAITVTIEGKKTTIIGSASSTVLVAFYGETGNFISMSSYPANRDIAVDSTPSGAVKAKIMHWNSLSGLTPLSGFKQIDL